MNGQQICSQFKKVEFLTRMVPFGWTQCTADLMLRIIKFYKKPAAGYLRVQNVWESEEAKAGV